MMLLLLLLLLLLIVFFSLLSFTTCRSQPEQTVARAVRSVFPAGSRSPISYLQYIFCLFASQYGHILNTNRLYYNFFFSFYYSPLEYIYFSLFYFLIRQKQLQMKRFIIFVKSSKQMWKSGHKIKTQNRRRNKKKCNIK